MTKSDYAFLPRGNFQGLIDLLTAAGYRCLGPTVRDGVIEFAPVTSIDELPQSVVDQQAPGSYRLVKGGGKRWFAWANGPQALKNLTFQPVEVLWEAPWRDGRLTFASQPLVPQPVAVIGVRACDLAALVLQERHFLGTNNKDLAFMARRKALLLIGVDCARPAATCFCADTGDGPVLQSGYDIGLTELDEGFLVNASSARGKEIVARLALSDASDAHLSQAQVQRELAVQSQSRGFPASRALKRLMDLPEHPHWDEIAERCLGCGNCTAICPTCFCASYETTGTLQGGSVQQTRVWDSCFTNGHSVVHGRPLREGLSQRYRQWLTHKLAAWQLQYGRSGCVGCGRCITWCPVGIDLTAEVVVLLNQEGPA